MEDSVLKTTKKLLGLADDYNVFDLDVITFINTALSDLSDLGFGTFTIEDDTFTWADLGLTENQTNQAKSLVFLKVKMLFDPPTLSFVIDAINKQIEKAEWRLNASREEAEHPMVVDTRTNVGSVYPEMTVKSLEEEPIW